MGAVKEDKTEIFNLRLFLSERRHLSNLWPHSSKPLRSVDSFQKRPLLIKQYCDPACLQGYWVISCILLVDLGYQGWTGKSSAAQIRTRPDGQGSSALSIIPQTSCPSACSGALNDNAGATAQGIFNWRDFLEPDNETIHRLEQSYGAHFTPPYYISSSHLRQVTGKWLMKCSKAIVISAVSIDVEHKGQEIIPFLLNIINIRWRLYFPGSLMVDILLTSLTQSFIYISNSVTVLSLIHLGCGYSTDNGKPCSASCFIVAVR